MAIFKFSPKFRKQSWFVLLMFSTFSFSQEQDLLYTTKLFEKIQENLPNDIGKAEQLTRKLLSFGIQSKSEKAKAKANYFFGYINYFKSRHYISNKYYLQALNSPYAKTDEAFVGACWNNIGINYEIQNLMIESLNAYQKSLKIAEKLKDSVSIGQSWINIGLLNAKAKNYKKGKEITQNALRYFIRKNDSLNIALCYLNLTFVLSDEKAYDKAIDYSYKGLAISKQLKNDYDIAGFYYNLGLNYFYVDDIKRSDYYLQKVLEETPADVGDRDGTFCKVYIQLGLNETEKENYALAEKYLLYAQKLIRKSGAFENELFAYQGLADLYAKSGNYDAYLDVTNEYDGKKEQHLVEESFARADELQAVYEFQKNADKIENQERDIISKKKQLTALMILLTIILAILMGVTFLYIRMRRYMRSLFENKVEQTLHDATTPQMPARIHHEMDDRKLKEIYNRVLTVMSAKKGNAAMQFRLAELCAEIGEEEEDVMQAITLFGMKDYHAFLNNYYIDEICKKMIKKGKRLDLKTVVAAFPFSSYSVFNKQFKMITGLTPEQFLDYSEQRLQTERKKAV